MRLSHVPIPKSHHVYLNGLEMQEGVDWTDDGTGLLTFLAPMGEVPGDLIECRYAHRGNVKSSDATIGILSAGVRGDGPSQTASFDTPPAAGSSVLVGTHSSFNQVTAMSGLGATWTKLAFNTSGQLLTIWIGEDCDGTSTDVTATGVGAGTIVISACEVIGVTQTGVQVDSGVGNLQGPLVAPDNGAIAFSNHGTSGGTTPTSETPAPWTDVPNPDNGTDVGVVDLSDGESASRTMETSGSWLMVLLAGA